MSEFNLTWRRYGLRDNPYFHGPLTIDGGCLDLSLFVGREKERNELKSVITAGSEVRFMVIGDPGVGKTSLVNYVKNEASENDFFTPANEIELNRPMSGNEFIILTIGRIHDELKRKNIKIKPALLEKLDALYELVKYGELSNDVANLVQLNRNKLMDLFKEVVDQVVYPRFKGMILHYDNLDNIDDADALVDMLSDIRDFLLKRKVIFFFVGDTFLPSIISSKKRLSQIFLMPALEVSYFSYDDIKKILDERIERLKISDVSNVVPPHTDEALRILYKLHGGNIREIINSLLTCVISLPPSNIPIQITGNLLKDILYTKIKNNYLLKITDVEKELLSLILNKGAITPTELSELTSKTPQNISSKYIPKLRYIGAVRLKSVEGRNKYYEATPEIKWWKLQRTESEIQKSRTKIQKQLKDITQKSLKDFVY